MEQIKTIPSDLWTRLRKVRVTETLKQWRKSPGLAVVLHELNRCVVECELVGNVTYDVRLYKAVRAYLRSESFAITGAPCIVKK